MSRNLGTLEVVSEKGEPSLSGLGFPRKRAPFSSLKTQDARLKTNPKGFRTRPKGECLDPSSEALPKLVGAFSQVVQRILGGLASQDGWFEISFGE